MLRKLINILKNPFRSAHSATEVAQNKLYLHEWFVIFVLISSILAVLFVGEIKRSTIKNHVVKQAQKREISTLVI